MENLWEMWRIHYISVGIDAEKMCYDGILNKTKYEESRLKILFLTKETNDFHQRDRKKESPAHLKDLYEDRGPYANFGYTISRWATGLLKGFPGFITIENDTKILTESLLSVAIINIKKISGLERTNWDDLIVYAKFDRDLLIKQIKEINPDIILACGITNEVIWLLDINVTEWMKKRKDGTKAHQLEPLYLNSFAAWLIHVLHPSSKYSNKYKYKLLEDKVEMCPQLKEMCGKK